MFDIFYLLAPIAIIAIFSVAALIIVWPDVVLWLPRQISPEFLK